MIREIMQDVFVDFVVPERRLIPFEAKAQNRDGTGSDDVSDVH